MGAATDFVVGLPFNTRIGVLAEETGQLALGDDPTLKNHVGTMHAGALFTLGEAASGVAVADLVAALGAVPLAKGASISYKRPANGRIHASGKIIEDVEGIRARLAADKKAVFDVSVALTDDAGTTVAEMTVTWHLRGG